jgi:hypothetical protein
MKNILTVVIMLGYCLTALAQPKYGHSIYNGQSEISLKISNPILELELKYQSGQKEKGIFGLGWTSDIEKNIIAVGDGTYLMKSICDCPGKKENYSFVPLGWEAKKLADVVDKMIPLLDNKYKKESLMGNYEQRYDLLQSLMATGKWKAPKLETGQKFYAFEMPTMSMEILNVGYKLIDGSRTYYFDTKGKTIKVEQSKRIYNLKYNTNNQLIAITDTLKGKIDFLYNTDGQIVKLLFEDKEFFSAAYHEGKLISFKNAENTYALSYDINDMLSSLKDEYEDELIQFTYGSNDLVNYKKYADYFTRYRYDTLATAQQKKISINEIKFFEEAADSKPIKNLYEITYGINLLGKEYLKHVSNSIEGESSSRSYAEGGSCQILEQENNGNKTHYTYNQSGLLTGKYNDNGAMIRAIYHPLTQKIVQSYDSDDRSSWFQYNEKGNLIFVENSEGDKLELVYDEKNEISLFHESSKTKDSRILYFRYNNFGKPVNIELEGIGAISVSYDKYNEIESVKSSGGHKISLAVTQAFQNLTAMVTPKGLNREVMSNRSGDNTFNYKSERVKDGLIAVGKDSNWGYQDESENWKIPANYEYAADFKDGWGIVRKNLKYGALKTDGTFWLALAYDFIAEPKNGYVRIMKNGKWGLVDMKGMEVLAPKYDYLFDADYEGFAKVKIGNLWNRINIKGDLFFKNSPNQFSSWNNKQWLVESSGKYGLYNEEADEILPVKYDQIEQPGENGQFLTNSAEIWNICSIKNGKISLSEDLNFKRVSISEQIIKAEIDDDKALYGLVDADGKILVSPKYEDLSNFYSDSINGGSDSKYYIFNTNDYKRGFLNSKGKILLEGIEIESYKIIYNNQTYYYYLAKDSIFLSAYNLQEVYQKDVKAALFTAQKGDFIGLLQQDALNKAKLNLILPYDSKTILIISGKYVLLKKNRYELYDLENKKTILKKIKDYSTMQFGDYEDRILYKLYLDKGLYFATEEHNKLSVLMKNIQATNSNYLYIVHTSKGYGIFDIAAFKMIVPDEYESIRESNGNFYGKKAGKEMLLEMND